MFKLISLQIFFQKKFVLKNIFFSQKTSKKFLKYQIGNKI
jgi:hypothetical protein